MKGSHWYQRRDALFIMVVGVALAIYFGQGHLLGPGRLTSELSEAIGGSDERVDVTITTKFLAGEFHIRQFQRIGNVRGVEGNDTFISNVEPSDIKMISRKYWIDQIHLTPFE